MGLRMVSKSISFVQRDRRLLPHWRCGLSGMPSVTMHTFVVDAEGDVFDLLLHNDFSTTWTALLRHWRQKVQAA